MSEHTPGPWYIEDRRPKGEHLQIQAQHRGPGSSYCIAHMNLWEAPDANARLIAAAPELLEAAQELINAFNFRAAAIVSFEGDDRVDFANKLMFKAVDKATAVISKATGAQP